MISIVIPTRIDSVQFLRQSLDSIARQTWSQSDIEVILAVNAHQTVVDAFTQTLPKYKFQLKTLVMGSNFGFARAANAGINLVAGKLILTLNDDAWLNHDFISQIIKTQTTTKADMVAATIYLADSDQIDSCGFDFCWRGQAWPLVPHHDQLMSKISLYPDNWINHQLLPTITFKQQPFGPDAAAALYTRKLFEQVGLFKPEFFAYLEDVDLALRARLQGMVCAWSDKAIAHHHKHATSKIMGKFKKFQDIKNWWRIVLRYKPKIWLKYGPLILMERSKNLVGYFKI